MIGSIVGTGVFTMPAVLAGAGTMGIGVLAVVAVGAMVLAVLFGQLTRRVPNSDGGLYAYSRHEFGDFAGYTVGWCYWIQSWAGNAAIVASWVFYVDVLFNLTNPSGMEDWRIVMFGLWIPAVINLAGVRQFAWFNNVTVVLKFLPLLFVAVVGWAYAQSHNFGPFNASGGSLYNASGSPPVWRCSPSSASRAQPWSPSGCATRAATSCGHPSSAPGPAPSSTSP